MWWCSGIFFFFFIKSDTHYKNPWSHAKLFFRRTNVTLWSNYQLNYLPWQAEILAQQSNLTPQRANSILWFACFTEVASLRSRHLEVVSLYRRPPPLEKKSIFSEGGGTSVHSLGSSGRKKERAREGRGRLPLPSRVSLSRARSFF